LNKERARTEKRRHSKKPNTALVVGRRGPSIIRLRVQQMRSREAKRRWAAVLAGNRGKRRSDGRAIKTSRRAPVNGLVKKNKII